MNQQELYIIMQDDIEEFFDLLKYSFDINDPYVLERMLAVSYETKWQDKIVVKSLKYKNDYYHNMQDYFI